MRHILLMLIFLTSVAYAEDYPSGQNIELFNIAHCDGPVKIKVTSEKGIKDDEISIRESSELSDNVWEGYCDGSFDVIIYTEDSVKNTYDITIEYYLSFINYNVGDTEKEIQNENNKRVKKIIDVNVRPEKLSKKFNISFDGDVKIIVVGILIALVVIAIIIFKAFHSAGLIEGRPNDDVLNYRTKKDEDIDEIIKHL